MSDNCPLFVGFPKIPRLQRECIITEKIDGTNAQLLITESGCIYAGSRTRWLTRQEDNFGFALWAEENYAELVKLGPGRHFGEWWGKGIQRGYGKADRTFSLFNTIKWADNPALPKCVSVVPVLAKINFEHLAAECFLQLASLRSKGSIAAPGFMKPEGIVVYHTAGHVCFKQTLDNDDACKST